jgi:hypothetical protein
MTFVVVVTGSRDWRYPEYVNLVLNALYVRHGAFILYHGGCQYTSGPRKGQLRGADAHADAWGRTVHGIDIRQRDADWDQYGKAAGPIRNKSMAIEALQVAQSIDNIRCVAFPRGESRGTYDAIRHARALGIFVDEKSEADARYAIGIRK